MVAGALGRRRLRRRLVAPLGAPFITYTPKSLR